MKYKEEQRNLFSVDQDYYFAQCISADFAMDAGIATQFNKHFDMKNRLVNKYGSFIHRWDDGECGTCVLESRVYNLITKRNYWHKPTYKTLWNALQSMKTMIINNPNVKKIAMPKIGCGLDKLRWDFVRDAILIAFEEVDIEILVCYQ